MASRLDELHAHQYSQRRVGNAITRHDPDPTGPTRQKSLTPTLVGATLATVLLLGVLVFNAITGQGTPKDLRDATTVLVEKESGAQYVYTKSDDRLHPVLNYASGLLIAEGSGAEPTTVRRKRMATLRRDTKLEIGAPLGIAGAPNAVPRRAELLRDPWQVCTRATTGASAPARTDLLVGARSLTGGHPLTAHGTTAEALLVQVADKGVFLVFGNRKFLIPKPAVVQAALGWSDQRPQPVSTGWINALPAGPDLAPLALDGLGESSAAVQADIGQLYQAPGRGTDQWAVVRRDDVQPISDVEARLLQADPDTDVGAPAKVSTAEFAALPLSGSRLSEPGRELLPATVPSLVNIGSTACVTVSDGTTGVTAIVVDPRTADTTTVTVERKPGETLADGVAVPFGSGVLVQSVASPTAPAGSGAVSLVTDRGLMYPIADPDALTRLGYATSTPLNMPAEVVSLLPTGPTLGSAAARTSAS
ncbi:type VII secretion protein EccB [Micromonosporaceae bacterium Da 78-11]